MGSTLLQVPGDAPHGPLGPSGRASLLAVFRAVALASLTLGCSPAPDDVSLEELVRRHTEAVGGEAALDSVRRLRVDLRIVEPELTVDAVYRVDRRGRMRIDVFADGRRVFTEAYDGDEAWQMGTDSATVTRAEDQAAAALWHGTQYPNNILALNDMEKQGHNLALAGRDTLEGVAYHVLRLTLSDGSETDWYVHPGTWRIERRRDVRALHPDQDATERRIETRWSDFRPVAGVLRPFRSRQVDLATGEVLQRTEVKRIEVNPEFPDDVFGRPR